MIESKEKLGEMAAIGYAAAREAAKHWHKRQLTPGPQWLVEEKRKFFKFVDPEAVAYYMFDTEGEANAFLGLTFMKIALLAIDGEGVKP